MNAIHPPGTAPRSSRVRKSVHDVVVAGDGQVTLGNTVHQGHSAQGAAHRRWHVIAGFAGATADAFTLFERLEAKLEQYPRQLTRACVELAKDWRTDRYLRRLEAMMAVADECLAGPDPAQAMSWNLTTA